MRKTNARKFESDLAILSAKVQHLEHELDTLYSIDGRDITYWDLVNLRTAARFIARARECVEEIRTSDSRNGETKKRIAELDRVGTA